MDAPVWFLVPFALVAVAVFVFFVSRRRVIADANQESAEKIFGRRPPDWLTQAGGWLNVLISGIIAAAAIVFLVGALG